jgi:hypothetical protein
LIQFDRDQIGYIGKKDHGCGIWIGAHVSVVVFGRKRNGVVAVTDAAVV